MTKRIEALRQQFDTLNEQAGIDAMLITCKSNIRYMSGFTGSSALLYISKTKQIIITDFRYMEQAGKQCEGFEVVDQKALGMLKTAMEIATEEGVKHIGFESAHTNYNTYRELSEHPFTFVPLTDVIETMRQIKSEDELTKLEKAEHIGDLAFTHIVSFIRDNYKNGLTEKDITLEIERVMRQNGASGVSFNAIVASGAKSSLCHATPGDETLHQGDFLVMDFGCLYEGYCSDMTRTLVIGEASDKHLHIYNTVLEAQLKALEAIKPGMKGKEVDAVARKVISDAGYGDYFGHG
ncbi:MAG: M24 family metallopeptidase, partial [Cellulosilyticaceae bacterium]